MVRNGVHDTLGYLRESAILWCLLGIILPGENRAWCSGWNWANQSCTQGHKGKRQRGQTHWSYDRLVDPSAASKLTHQQPVRWASWIWSILLSARLCRVGYASCTLECWEAELALPMGTAVIWVCFLKICAGSWTLSCNMRAEVITSLWEHCSWKGLV